MWQFLDDSGVLDNGTDEEIKEVKREYRKLYLTKWKRDRRLNHPEFTISLNKDENELIALQAIKHNRSRTAYLKAAALAYTNKTYVVPDKATLARIEQVLGSVYNCVDAIAQERQSTLFTRERDFVQLKKMVEGLEANISKSLREPRSVDEFIQRVIPNNENARERILSIVKAHL
ncbi:hypothetical protein COB64_04025 [Candidatus Wolfebacteria bacterium]|nr:MAG: hypothetical protein COB64_04025 [Candidatus Wolfebacteria bacterium]